VYYAPYSITMNLYSMFFFPKNANCRAWELLQKIPQGYIDHIIIALRKAGLITAVRGKGGGVKLKLSAEDISVWEILNAAEISMKPVCCLDNEAACEIRGECISFDGWRLIANVIKEAISNISLRKLVSGKSKGNFIDRLEVRGSGVGCPTISKQPKKLFSITKRLLTFILWKKS